MLQGISKSLKERYPLHVALSEDTEVVIRPLCEDDEEALLAHYRALPPETRLRLRQDNTNRAVLKRFLEEMPLGRAVVLGAFDDEEEQLLGEGTLRIMHHGWARHVGEIRYLVDADWVPTGLGGVLIMELIELASAQGLDKLVYQTLDVQVRLRKMLKELGFTEEAILRNHATDLAGQKHDIHVMSNYMAELWRKMEDMILDHEFPPYP